LQAYEQLALRKHLPAVRQVQQVRQLGPVEESLVQQRVLQQRVPVEVSLV
jgi:hypothetical protein